MKFNYDFHIHSALSPCADNDMTPINIVAAASAVGLEMIAVADHNAIANVKAAIEVGKMLDVTVVPAIELQTAEDIHMLCLFPTYEKLEAFYESLEFPAIENRSEIFGQQLIYDLDNEVCGYEPRMLLASATVSEYEVGELAERFDGIAVPAHIDRASNGILAILGSLPEGYTAVELSYRCPPDAGAQFLKDYNVISDSDAHCLADLGKRRFLIDLPERSAEALIEYLRHKR